MFLGILFFMFFMFFMFLVFFFLNGSGVFTMFGRYFSFDVSGVYLFVSLLLLLLLLLFLLLTYQSMH